MSETGTRSLLGMEDKGDFCDPEMMLEQLLDDPNLIQHVTRTDNSGRETITGYFRVTFELGQQRQVLHVPFVPSLKVVPQVESRVTDQADARVRITDRQKFGVRAEIVLSRPAESARRMLVEISATESI